MQNSAQDKLKLDVKGKAVNGNPNVGGLFQHHQSVYESVGAHGQGVPFKTSGQTRQAYSQMPLDVRQIQLQNTQQSHKSPGVGMQLNPRTSKVPTSRTENPPLKADLGDSDGPRAE
jgi:hypothetical protein